MTLQTTACGLALLVLGLTSPAQAQAVRQPSGEFFQMGRVGGSTDDDPTYFFAQFQASTDGSLSGIVHMNAAGEDMLGMWTIDPDTGAVTIDIGFGAETHCESWPVYEPGETISFDPPSEKNCWVGTNHAPYVHSMIYEGLR
tara:strand:+ start:110 stop:535 length:426 start_codon:yes stop_codon:yes gene_type:complete